MKIKYALHSVNNDPLYLDFWPLVAKLWKLKFNVTPILVYVGKDRPKLDEQYGKVFYLPRIDGIPEAMQAQWARFWYTQHFNESTCIISDIDMFPLSINYFIKQIETIHTNDYVHLNPCIEEYGALPACYHVATGHNFKKIFQLSYDWKQSLMTLLNFNQNLPKDFKYHNNATTWFADERYSTHQIMDTEHNVKIHLLKRKGSFESYRIDRLNWKYNHALLKHDYYIDAHLLRPFNEHSTKLEQIVEISLTATETSPNFIQKTYYKLLG